MKSDIHLRVDDSKTKRINVLKSAKALTEQLRDYNSLKKLKERRMKLMSRLDDTLYEIKTIYDEMKIKDVPDVHLYGRGEEPKTEEKLEKKTAAPKVAPVKIDKKETQLSNELAEIERKLASL